MKDRAAAGRVIEADLPAEPRDDLLHNAEPKAGTALLPRVRGIGLREFLENARLEVLGNAVAVVSNGDKDRTAPPFDCDYDFFAPRRKFDRIREQVRDDLDESIRVGAYFNGCRSGVEPHPHSIIIGKPTIGFDRLLNKRANFDSL